MHCPGALWPKAALVFLDALLPKSPKLLAEREGHDLAQHADNVDAAVVPGLEGSPHMKNRSPSALPLLVSHAAWPGPQ